MGRRIRADHPGAIHFATNRGTAQTAIVRDDLDRHAFLGELAALRPRFGVAVLAFVLMDNHFHLIVRCDEARLSDAMQRLQGRYARGFNRRHGRAGALFQGRFDAGAITSEDGLDRAGAYVHLNPMAAGMVNDPAAFRWSSLPSYVRGEPLFEWLQLDLLADRTPAEYLAAMASVDSQASTIEPATAADALPWLTRSHRDGLVRAGRVFGASDQIVAAALGASVDEIYIPTIGKLNAVRLVGIAHAAQTCGFSLREVAARYGLRSPGSIQSARARLRRIAETDATLAEQLQQLAIVA